MSSISSYAQEIQDVGGEPLEGSAFEAEEPSTEEGFADATQEEGADQ